MSIQGVPLFVVVPASLRIFDRGDLLLTPGQAWILQGPSNAVTKLIESAQPSIDYTQRKYGDAHDAFVASATYNRALDAAAEVLQRLQARCLHT